MFSAAQLVAGYGETQIINGVNLTIERGTVTAILGRNGMGKSTLLRAFFALASKFSGTLEIDGTRLKDDRPEQRAGLGMALLPDDRGVFPGLTIAENLKLATKRGYKCPVDVTILFPLLKERPADLAGNLSGGQKQQLGIARAMLAGSNLICIDEYSQGLSPRIAKAGLEALRTLASTGTATVFVEQAPDLALAYADRIIGMEGGRIVFDVPVAIARADQSVLASLLVIQ
jgi:ABC-type branched-subunit amino acid transport system ATPase component